MDVTRDNDVGCSSEFGELGLIPELLRAIRDAQYDTPTPVQSLAIPVALRGNDVLACAQTGTGKTAGFLLPILQRLRRDPDDRRLRALVLTPTRELAVQIGESARTYGKYVPVRSTVVYGGVGLGPQIDRLQAGVDLLIATPGRLLDHMNRGNLTLADLQVLVLDEADRMLDMGFLPDVRRILAVVPDRRQTLLFSATMPREIERLAQDTLHEPELIDVGPRATPVATLRHVLYLVEAERKAELLFHLLRHRSLKHVLVFTRTKVRAERLAKRLAKSHRRVAALHGDKSQAVRTQVLNDFKRAKLDVVVATDVAARGLDVEGISHVVNFDVPHRPEDYVHRIGRTARAEAQGNAVTFAAAEEADAVRAIESLLRKPIERKMIQGFEPTHFTIRRYEKPDTSRGARIASGSIRHFRPRGGRRQTA